MAFVDPTQPGQDETNQNPSQVDQALNPSASQTSQQQNQAAPPSTSSGGAGVASAGSAPGASGTPGQSQGAPKPSSSGSWTNLDSYLNANSDQATQMGQQIAGGVNQAGQKAQSDINDLGTNFGNAVQQNTVNANPDAVNKAVSDATSLTSGQKLSSEDQQAFNTQANANYAGPSDVTSFNGYNQAQTDVAGATQKANETKTEGGRASLLNDQFKNASAYGYTPGENNLDQLLLENSSGAQGALQPLATQWAGLNGALNQTVTQGATEAQTAAQTDAATANAAKNALSTANQNFENNLNSGLQALQQKDQTAWQAVQTALQKGDIAGANAAATAAGINLGLDPTQHIYGGRDSQGDMTGTQLASYLAQGATPTLGTYATADQYAEAQALAQLAGQSSSGFLSPAGLADAGTAQTTPAYTFNNTQEASDNSANQALYNNSSQTLLNQIVQQNPDGFSNSAYSGMPMNNLDDAANFLNTMIAWSRYTMSTSPNPQSQSDLQWAQSQLQNINNLQQANGFGTYASYQGTGVPIGTPITGLNPQVIK